MTTVNQLPHGWDEIAFAVAEATFGAVEDVTATEAFEFTSIDMGEVQMQRRAPAKHKEAKRSYAQVVKGRFEPVPFTIRGKILPSGDAGDVPPDMNALFKNAFGTATDTPATSSVYTFSDQPSEGLTVVHGDATQNVGQWGYGGIIKKITFESGEEEIGVEFSGEFAGKSSVAAFVANHGGEIPIEAGPTVVTLAADSVYRIVGVGQYVKDPAQDEIMKISAVDYAAGTVTLLRDQLSTSATIHAQDATFEPYFPSQTLAADARPIGEQEGVYTLHGKSIYPVKYNIEINTGREFRVFEKGSARRRGVKALPTTVNGSVTLHGDREFFEFFGRAAAFTESTMSFTEGDTTNWKFKLDAGVVHCGINKIDLPEDGDVVMLDVPMDFFNWDNADSPIRASFL